jgi:hypothetical protein
MVLIDKTSIGHMIAVNASGKVAAYHVFLGGALILTLPIAYMFVKMGLGVYSVGVAMVMTMAVCAWGRIWFARHLVGMSAWYWIKRIFLPIIGLITVAYVSGSSVCLLLSPSFIRLLITTLVVEIILVVVGWFFVLDCSERVFVAKKLETVLNRVTRR